MQIEDKQKTKSKDKKKHKRKRLAKSESKEAPTTENCEATLPNKKKKRSKLIKQPSDLDELELSKSEVTKCDDGETSAQSTTDKKKESIRQRKRKKYEKLLAEKKTLTDVLSQQKALNYLSQWKHNREDWKFEKLKQVWLQQNLFNSATIPDTFWNTTLEYFSNSKGQSRQSLIDKAMKIIETAEKEAEDKSEELENDDEEVKSKEEAHTKLDRAREILQHLQE